MKSFKINPSEYGLYALSEVAVKFNESIQESGIILGTTERKVLAMRAFFEMSERLDYRYSGLKQIETVVSQASYLENVPVHRIQLEFLNRIESYFQHHYATISALALLINTVGSHEIKRSLPIGSNKKLLDFLNGIDGLSVADEVTKLEKARNFRAKYVDHIQQQKPYDWMTYGFPTDDSGNRLCVAIYYIPNKDSNSERTTGNSPMNLTVHFKIKEAPRVMKS